MAQLQIKYECPACKASGVLRIKKSADRVGVPCNECRGQGFLVLDYTPFTERTVLSGIDTIVNARFGDQSISYSDFKAGKRP